MRLARISACSGTCALLVVSAGSGAPIQLLEHGFDRYAS
jgi:hypothetical protein